VGSGEIIDGSSMKWLTKVKLQVLDLKRITATMFGQSARKIGNGVDKFISNVQQKLR